MRLIKVLSLVLPLIWAGYTAHAHAITIMFTEHSAWQTAVLASGYTSTNIDFESAMVSSVNNTVTSGDIVFTSPGVALEVRDYGIPYNSGMVLYPAFNQPIQISLTSNVYAFGFDLGEIFGINDMPPPTLENVQLSTGDIFTGPYNGNAYPTYAFFGFISNVPITSLSMETHAVVEPIIDNFTYAVDSAAPVPEPSSLLLLSSGLFVFVGYAWRNWRK